MNVYQPRASHRFPIKPLRHWQKNPPTPFGIQVPAFKHDSLLHILFARIICAIVVVDIVVIGTNVVVLVVVVATISSHRTPVKLGKQTHTKPPTDVSEHVPWLKQGSIEHGLGGAVIRIAK